MRRFIVFILMLIMISSACFAAVSFPDLKIHVKNKNGDYRYTSNGEPVIEDHWATREIMKAANIGLIEGYPDGNFMPDINITRGEFIKLVMSSSMPSARWASPRPALTASPTSMWTSPPRSPLTPTPGSSPTWLAWQAKRTSSSATARARCWAPT